MHFYIENYLCLQEIDLIKGISAISWVRLYQTDSFPVFPIYLLSSTLLEPKKLNSQVGKRGRNSWIRQFLVFKMPPSHQDVSRMSWEPLFVLSAFTCHSLSMTSLYYVDLWCSHQRTELLPAADDPSLSNSHHLQDGAFSLPPAASPQIKTRVFNACKGYIPFPAVQKDNRFHLIERIPFVTAPVNF